MEKVLSEAGTERFRQRYLRGGRREKSRVLDEFCELTKCHRKHASRVFSKRLAGRPANPEKRGRKSRYDRPEFVRALESRYARTPAAWNIGVKLQTVFRWPGVVSSGSARNVSSDSNWALSAFCDSEINPRIRHL